MGENYNCVDFAKFLYQIRGSLIESVEYESDEENDLISIFFCDNEYVLNFSFSSNHRHLIGTDSDFSQLTNRKLRNVYFSSDFSHLDNSIATNFFIHFDLYEEVGKSNKFVCHIWHEKNSYECQLNFEFHITERIRSTSIWDESILEQNVMIGVC